MSCLILVLSTAAAVMEGKAQLPVSWEHLAFFAANEGRLALHLLQTAGSSFVLLAVLGLGVGGIIPHLPTWLGPYTRRLSPRSRVGVLLVSLSTLLVCGLALGWRQPLWGLVSRPQEEEKLAFQGPLPGLTPKSAPFLPRPAGNFSPKPVIVILVESLRGDLFQWEPSPVPFLRRLAGESWVCARAYAPSSHSNYGDLAVWYSAYPLRGNRPLEYRANDPGRGVSLFEVFKALGYSTAYISSQNEKWGGMISWLAGLGIDFFSIPRTSAAPPGKIPMTRRD